VALAEVEVEVEVNGQLVRLRRCGSNCNSNGSGTLYVAIYQEHYLGVFLFISYESWNVYNHDDVSARAILPITLASKSRALLYGKRTLLFFNHKNPPASNYLLVQACPTPSDPARTTPLSISRTLLFLS